MATMQDYENALIKAHEAGNVDDAKMLASHIKQLRSSQTTPAPVAKNAEPSITQDVLNTAGDIGLGALQGAANIGSTIMQPIDYLRDSTGELNKQRRADVKAGIESLGAKSDSLAFNAGKLGAETAGTWAAGGGLSKLFGVAKYAPQLAAAMESGGMAAGDILPRIAGGAISGAAQSGMINPDEATTGAVMGGAAPAIGKMVSGAARMATGGNVSNEVKDLVEKAGQYGIDVPVDRILKSKPLNAFASSLEYVPFSGRTQTLDNMTDQLKTALSKTMGEDTPNLATAYANAKKRISGEYDKAFSHPVNVDNKLMQDLAKHIADADQVLLDKAPIIKNFANQIYGAVDENGMINANAMDSLKKRLAVLANSSDSSVAHYAGEMKKSIKDAIHRSMSPEDSAKLALTDKQFGAMASLKNLIKSGAEGDISPAAFANMKLKGNHPDLQNLKDISAQFMKGRESPHGAAQRVTMGGLAGALAGTGNIPSLMGLIGGSNIANKLLNSDMARNAVLNGVQVPRKAGEATIKTAIPLVTEMKNASKPKRNSK